jgi:hypothetical protein
MTITFTLTAETSGTTQSGDYRISGTTDSGAVNGVFIASGITRAQLTTGYTATGISDSLTGGTITSTGSASGGFCTTQVTWYVDGPPATSVLLDNDFILGITETSTCPGTGTPQGVYISQFDYDNRYSQSGIKFITLYQDDSLTTPWTGYGFVYVIGDTGEINEVYQLNTSTGQIGNPAGAQPC